MKVSIANFFIKDGDLEYNFNTIEKYYTKAVNEDIELIIFPRLALSGLCGDKLLDINFLKDTVKYFEKVIELTVGKKTSIIMGGIHFEDAKILNEIKYEKESYDSIFLISNGYLEDIVHRKELSKENQLNDYKYFNKYSYISNFTFKNKKYSALICDDIYYDNNLYLIRDQKLNFLLCFDSQHKVGTNIIKRLDKISKFASCPIIYINNATYFDDNFFDGTIILIDENNKLVYQNQYEKDELLNFNLDHEDGSDLYICNSIVKQKNNLSILINKLSEIEHKQVVLNDNLLLKPNIIQNIDCLSNIKIDFNKYFSKYNELNDLDKIKVSKIIINNFYKNLIFIYND